MKRFSFLSRLAAAGLTAILLTAPAQAALIDGGFSYSFRIGEGTTYTRTDGANSAGIQHANAIEYTPSSSVTPIGVRSGTQFYGNKSTLSAAAASLESKGYDVIGGINADFFSTDNGIPTGVVVDNGRIIACNTWQSAVGFREDGSALIGQPVTSITVSGVSGKVGVYAYNKTRTSVGLYLLDSYYYNSTRFSTPGQSIILEYQNKADLRIGHPAKFTVVDKVDGSSSFPIGENQMVLTRRSDCTSAWIDYPIGEEITITFNSMTAGWDTVKYAVGGKALVTNGASTPTSIDRASSHCARTAVGTKADGTVVLFEVDGESSYSRGMTANELAAEMIARGCTNAVCLDGGGSSMMTIQEPATSSSKLISRPSDGSERKVSNFVFLVNKLPSDGEPAYLYLDPVARYVLPGAATTFSTTAVDQASVATALPDDITYSVDGGRGSVADDKFYAGSSTGEVNVRATSDSASGSMQLMVTGAITSASFSSKGESISSASVRAGDSVDIDATVFYNGSTVASRDDLLNWSVTGGVGTIDKNGVFTGTTKGSGTIVMSYGSYSKSLPVTVGMGAAQELTTIADFESEQPLSGDASLTRVTASNQVARGTGSLLVGHNGTATISLPVTAVGQTPVLSLWAKADSGAQLTALYTDAEGNTLTAPFSSSVTSSYTFLTATAPQGAVNLVGLAISGTPGQVYLDHIQVSQTAPLATGAPKITITSAPSTVEVSANVTVTARITQENDSAPVRARNVKAYINGSRSSAASYSEATGTLTVPLGQLGAGLHTVVIEAADDAGNLSRATATIQAGSLTSHAFVDTSGSWAASYIDRLAARGIMQGSTVNGKSYYYPNNNLKRSEFAAIIARTLGLDTSSTEGLNYTDLASIPEWARGPVAAVTRAGLMTGTSDGRFNPNAAITRAEAMTVISRSLPRGYAVKTLPFSDVSSIPDWAISHVQYTYSIGLIGGYPDGTFRPSGQITRAEIAKIFCYL